MATITAPMTTAARIAATVEDAYDSAGYNDLERAVSGMMGASLASFVRWDCESDRCPARPVSDIALGDLYEQTDAWVEDAAALIKARLAAALSAIVDAHPDIAWKKAA